MRGSFPLITHYSSLITAFFRPHSIHQSSGIAPSASACFISSDWSFGNPSGNSPGKNHAACWISKLSRSVSPIARAMKIISTCFDLLNARMVNSFSRSTSSPISSRSSRRSPASGCSPRSRKPPGIPQPAPGRKRCLSNNTRPRPSVMTAPAVTAKRGCESLTVQRRSAFGARRQIAPSRSFSI